MPTTVMQDDLDAADSAFLRTVTTLSAEQLRGPSRLPGWTRAHVVAHVALNAEGFVRVADALRSGTTAVMYPDGDEGRDRAIGELAASPPDVLAERAVAASRAFVDAWHPAPPPGPCRSAERDPTFASSTVPLRRWRELQVHLVDLGVPGIGVEAWSPRFVDVDLPLQWATVAHRTEAVVAVVDERGVEWSTGAAGRRGALVRVPRRLLLGWVLDRCEIDGLPPLAPWSNRSKWEHLDGA